MTAPDDSDRPRFINPATIVAVVATTLPGLFQGMVDATPATTVAMVVLTVAALALSIGGLGWAERRPGLKAVAVVTVLYGAVVLAALTITGVRAFLISMPFASVVVLYFSLRVAIAVELVLLGWVSGVFVRWVETPAQLIGAIAGFASAVAFVFVFSLIARRERYARRDVERLNKQVEELATSRERNRIAREIHDSLGHYLTVANVQLEAARAAPDGREERLVRVQQLLREGLVELRSSVSLLREGASTPRPFAQALDGLVAECNATGLSAELVTTGAARPLPAEVGFTLYRAAQEALTNVRRHAKAKRVSVRLAYGGPKVTLKVADDGVGRAADARFDGNGLKGLQERVAQVGGTVAFEQPAGGGFQLTVEVPA